MSLQGQKVLVTGASSGIGAALAPQLAAAGATVGIVARRRDRLAEVLERCRGHTGDSRMWQVDLSDLDAAARVVADAWEVFGGIDVLVNNAAMPKRKRLQRLAFEEYEEVMNLDFLSPVRMTTQALPRMIERGSGQIVMVASTGGRMGIVHEAAYCAAKGALCLWAEAAAIDIAVHDLPIRVKLVNPGPIDTEIWQVRSEGDDPPLARGVVPADECAAGIVEAIEAGPGFEFYVPDMRPVIDQKNADVDGFLLQMASVFKEQLPDED